MLCSKSDVNISEHVKASISNITPIKILFVERIFLQSGCNLKWPE